jgi:hypothetical protein
MAAGTFTMFDKALLNVVNATHLLDPANTFKWTLHTSAYTPGVATHEVYADLTNELATANGYTAGGATLANDAVTLAAGTVKFTGDPTSWTASGGSIPAWRTAVLRVSGTLNGKVDPLVGYFLGDSTPADVPATTTGNTLTITPNASGIVAATHTP